MKSLPNLKNQSSVNKLISGPIFSLPSYRQKIGVVFGLTASLVTAIGLGAPLKAIADDQAKNVTQKTIELPSLTVHVGGCPRKIERGIASPAVGPAVVAAGIASSLTGAAVDAVAEYLTQTRVASFFGSKGLDSGDMQKLFVNQDNQCLFTFLLTPALNKYFSDNKISLEQSNGTAFITPEQLLDIEKKGVAKFMAVMSFEPNKPEPATNANSEVSTDKDSFAFYRTYVWKLIYPKFIDANCPPLRMCNARDIVMRLRFAYPTNPDPSETKNKASALNLVFQNVSTNTVISSVSEQYSGWFAYNGKPPTLSNVEFSLTETSKPGEVAKALAAALKANKEAIGKLSISPF